MTRVQIGVTASRGPSGEFGPARPIYREIPDAEREAPEVPEIPDEVLDKFARGILQLMKERRDAVTDQTE